MSDECPPDTNRYLWGLAQAPAAIADARAAAPAVQFTVPWKLPQGRQDRRRRGYSPGHARRRERGPD